MTAVETAQLIQLGYYRCQILLITSIWQLYTTRSFCLV